MEIIRKQLLLEICNSIIPKHVASPRASILVLPVTDP